ncbi:MAG: hypothetical protein Tsb006_4570 [Rickettsiaceae bacterium]
MRLAKFIIVILILGFLGVIGLWYYVTGKVAAELNSKYAGQKFDITGLDKSEYFVTFKEVVPAGFPYKIAWEVIGWQEESKGAQIVYNSPVKFGYDLLTQKVFVSYNGDITASYKPVKHGFGATLKVNDYNLVVDLPLTGQLVETLKKMEDPVQFINHIGDINISTGKVEIFDLEDNEKFYDKEYERLRISFIPRKTYTNLEDLLKNIPGQYTINYVVKNKPISARMRRLPVSLFYGFSSIPTGFDLKVNAAVKTEGKSAEEFMKGLEVKANLVYNSSFLDLPNFKLYYKSGDYADGRDYTIDVVSQIQTKAGLFDQIFAKYNTYSAGYTNTSVGMMIDNEVKYIIRNKDAFRFKDLEDSAYEFNLKLSTERQQNKIYTKIDDFSILSEKSGIRLKHDMEMKQGGRDWKAKGVLYINNYPTVIEFTSGYIYRFGKFRFLNKEARNLYVDVNKAFLKDISDYPKSESNDLSFEYSVDSSNLAKTKIGSVEVSQITKLYTLMLYQKLFDKVGPGGDVLGRMKQILPGIDANEPMLSKILPRISGEKSLDKQIQKQIDKAIPNEAKDIIKKVIPKDKIGKELFKNLVN